MDDHFFNRVGKSEGLFDLLIENSDKLGVASEWIVELEKLRDARVSGDVFIWGSGQQCEAIIKRIQRHPDNKLCIKGVVDSHSHNWGKQTLKFLVESPDKVSADANIIIGSSNYYAEIYQQIVKTGISPNKIVPNIFL